MKLIVGLGNPGREYERTRHNVGWWVLDHLADVWRFEGWKRDGKGVAATARIDGVLVRLLKPQTFMNLSGAALKPYARRPFWSAAGDLLVVVDEVALPLGAFRLRARGSAGGHNGLKSIEQQLGTQEYARLRIGIAPEDRRRMGEDPADFVLGAAGKAEREAVQSLFPDLRDAAETWVRDGIDRAMNAHNQ
jgi:PTH1 family peptidyl-tRNA hydrolase